ncbi:MAG: ribonuclease R [Acidiferrobacterales bacterium]
MSNRVSGEPKAPVDPMAEREAQKYEFPVPSREAVLAHLAQRGEPLSLKFLASELGVDGERDIEAFGRRLRAMERDGQLLKNRRGRYGLLQKMDMVRGRVVGHPDGFGFLIPDEGGADLFLPPKEMRAVLHGDRVVARVAGIDVRGRREGTVVEVLERANAVIVGRYSSENRISFVVPSDKRISQEILIPPGDDLGARDGQIVVAAVTEPPTSRSRPVGRIAEVLGDHMAPGMEVEVAIRMYDLPHNWPDVVLDETSGLSPEVPPGSKEGREDLRSVPLVTIDGEDARDFDDAVFCERQGRAFRLIVAIADVSSYVLPGSALDAEAYRRGNSVYFPNHVIPMLPEILSNGLCSLNPEVDRLCVACEMHIGAGGKIEDYRFFRAVMRSHARLTYTQVAAMLVDQDAELQRRYAALQPHLDDLYALYKVLHKARAARGAVDFELPETRIIYDEQRKIERIVPLVRNDAHRIIEECMLAANVSAAELLARHKKAVPFRVHAGPTAEKLAALREFLFELGLSLGGGDEPKARDYARLLLSVEGRPDARLVHTVMLRSLSQALYTPDNIGHFALGYPNYAHFTSPIRRYPDLLVHRAISEVLERRSSTVSLAEAQVQGEHFSMTERRADEATREVVRWLKTEFMVAKVGELFNGIISGVTNFGLFVELEDVYVDGLVHITALGNDYYHFDASRHRLVGDRTRRVFRLGDPVRVRVVRVDLDEAKIDFELVDEGAPPLQPERSTRKVRRTPQRTAQKAQRRGPAGKKAPRRAK